MSVNVGAPSLARTQSRAAAIRSTSTGESIRRSLLRSSIVGPFTVFLVTLSFALTAGVAVFVQNRIGTYLAAISRSIDPGRRAAADLQLALAMEAAGTRGYLLTGRQEYATTFREARQKRVAAYDKLVGLSQQVNPELRSGIEGIGRTLNVADSQLDALYRGEMTRAEYTGLLPAQHVRFAEVTMATARLHQSLDAHAAALRHRVHQTQRIGMALMIAGLALAMTVIASVTRLSTKYRDLADRERAARAEADERRREGERIAASRQRLTRGFSHDVKNPLAAADGYLAMLEQGAAEPLAPRQRQFVEKSRRSLTAAVQLIADLLELARAEQGDLEIRYAPVDLRQIVAHAVEDYRSQAAAKGLDLAADLTSDVPIFDSDSARITQVLGNLIVNAIKYTTAGTVTVRVALRQGADAVERAAIDVCDTGPGIAEQHHGAIFGEFCRLDTSQATGAGIGLAISRRIAEALGGEIALESQAGCGSRFTLWLPLHPSGAPSLVAGRT